MITIREIEKDERHAAYVIKKFIQTHPVFVLLASTIGVCFAIVIFSIIMLLGVVGGNQVSIVMQKEVCEGQMTLGTYGFIMNSLTIIFNSVGVIMNFVISFIIVFWIYVIFREYLKYKRDNL